MTTTPKPIKPREVTFTLSILSLLVSGVFFECGFVAFPVMLIFVSIILLCLGAWAFRDIDRPYWYSECYKDEEKSNNGH